MTRDDDSDDEDLSIESEENAREKLTIDDSKRLKSRQDTTARKKWLQKVCPFHQLSFYLHVIDIEASLDEKANNIVNPRDHNPTLFKTISLSFRSIFLSFPFPFIHLFV